MGSLSGIFAKRTQSIDIIFDSYKTLYNIYSEMMKTANVNKNKSSCIRKMQNYSRTNTGRYIYKTTYSSLYTFDGIF